MGKVWVFLVLAAIATALPAQQMFKCKQADGTISYQQLPCAESAQRQELNIHAPPPPTPVQTRRMVQAFDPETGIPTEAWIDGPAPPIGQTYTTREFRTVVDPQTGIPRQALVDVQHAVPAPRSNPPPSGKRNLQFSPPGEYYNPDAQERSENSTYEKARCRVRC